MTGTVRSMRRSRTCWRWRVGFMAVYKPFRDVFESGGCGTARIGVRRASCRLESGREGGSAAEPDAYVNRQYQYASRPAPAGALCEQVGFAWQDIVTTCSRYPS